MIDEVKMFPSLISELLDNGRSVRFSAPGRSMYPTIREGETITVRPVSSSAVKVGDIILYCWEKGVIAHRVVGTENTHAGGPRFILRGDSSGACDERVKPEQILGKVVVADRNGRPIDLYSIPSKVRRHLHPFASRFKQWALQKAIRRP